MRLDQAFKEGTYTEAQAAALRRLAAHVPLWFGFEPGKKIPRAATGPGDTSDPSRAMQLDDALAQMQRQGWGGVSALMTTASPELVGIDIDHCLSEGEPNELAREAMAQFGGAYAEVSPSGTGLRMFCLGTVPDGTPSKRVLRDGVGVEVYPGGSKRHLRMTGAVIEGTAGAVAPCQAGINWLCEAMAQAAPDNVNEQAETNSRRPGAGSLCVEEVFEAMARLRPQRCAHDILLEMIAEAGHRPRGKLAAALRGDLSHWSGDHSAADLFMCAEAARRGAGSELDIEDVWQGSKLAARSKFKRKDYRQRTIGQAVRAALSGLREKPGRRSSDAHAKPVELPADLAQSLERSGDKLVTGKGGRLASEPGNVVVLFRNVPQLGGLLGFNELAQAAQRLASWRVFDREAAAAPGPLTDDDITRVGMYLERAWGMRVERRELTRAIDAAARDAAFDPLRDRLLALGRTWDQVARLDSWLVHWARVDDTDCREYASAVGARFMIGAVARALQPGCKFDTVLAIEGEGGGGKSTMFQVLADSVATGLFTDGVHDVSSTTALVEATGGRWIVEIAELAGVRRAADIEALKAALTRTEDSHRRPYDVLPRSIPRRFVFVATTNRSEYLNDPSGALLRRFWPVRTVATEAHPIDLQGLAVVAPQLWAEAVVRFQRGEAWHLSADDGAAYVQWTASREQRREDGAFHDEAMDYLAAWELDWAAGEQRGRELREIAREVGDMRTVEGDQAARNRLADTLRGLGLKCVKAGGGKKRWVLTSDAQRRALLHRGAERKGQKDMTGGVTP